MQPAKPMMGNDAHKTADLKARIERGEYHVDARAVADAILRRLALVAAPGREPADGQKECS